MALSPAEKQRAYRERLRSKLTEAGNVTETETRAKAIVDSLGISTMDCHTCSYFVGRLIGQLCSELAIEYVIVGLIDSLGNVTQE